MDEKEINSSNIDTESPDEGEQEPLEKKSAKGDKIARKLHSSNALPYASPEVLADMVKAYVIASGQGTEAVKYADAAAVAAMHPTAVSRNNAFLAESGLIVPERHGYFRPSHESIEYAKRAPWDEEGARKYVRQAIDGTWYGDTVRQQLQMHGQLSKDKIVKAFGIKTGADQGDAPRLSILFDFLTYFGYLVEDGAGNYIRNPEDARRGVEPAPGLDEAIPTVMDGESPAAVVDRMLVQSPPAMGRTRGSVTPSVNINVSITPSMTDSELQSLADKVRRLLLLLDDSQ